MKKYLLDSHVLIWAIGSSNKLPKKVLEILQDSNSQVFVSAVSLWEIAIKHGKGKLKLGNFQIHNIPDYCEEMEIQQIPLTSDVAIGYSNLPFYEEHKDPFDRMLIYQCIKGDYTLVSRDDKMKIYEKDKLNCIW
jgi:PIN domain nuclease of toxin-antitoxin system